MHFIFKVSFAYDIFLPHNVEMKFFLKKVSELTGGKDLVTWLVSRFFFPCFSKLRLNTEGSIEAVMSHILQTAVLYLRHLLKFNLQ